LALRDQDLFRADCDCYAATLTSLDERFARKWEKNAPPPSDRVAALKAFFDAGIFTYVSIEPAMDKEMVLEIVKVTRPFVDLYKVGQLNHSKRPDTIDPRDLVLRMIEVVTRVGRKCYFKKDLQPFLPRGYQNPMRVPQHHGGAAP